MLDVLIIGAGVTGCSVARELSRYQANICVVDQNEDVCSETSKANSAIVHAGFDAATGTMMAKMNVAGNAQMDQLAQELDIPFKRIGSLVVCLNEEDLPGLKALYDKGIKNGVPNLTILNKQALHEMEPNVTPDAVAALYAPTGGVVCPFAMTFALAENAAANGVEFSMNTKVTSIEQTAEGWKVITNQGEIQTKYVVNAAGVYADVFHNMVSEDKIHITPRRGDYCLLDKAAGSHVSHTVFQLPTRLGKGVLVTPTVHGNLLVGPTAYDIEDKDGVNTTAQGIDDLIQKSNGTVLNLPMRQVITSFAGLRAHEDGHEFILGEVADAPGFVDCAGIESPGLSSAPAIGPYIAEMLKEKMNLCEKDDFNPIRKAIVNPKDLSKEAYAALIKEKPAYGQIICRCEEITEGEILDAIHRPMGARSMDGIKRRTRAQMGRCQGGFCSPRILEILARELNVPMDEISKNGGNSTYIVGTIKDTL